jgi:DNA repair protein RadC
MEAVKQKVTEIEVVYKNKQKASERPTIKQSSDALTHLVDAYDSNTIGLQEQFVVLYMNNAHKVLGTYRAAAGGLTSTIADIRLILSVALKIAATSMIVSHNHPTGTLKPSSQDEDLTRRLKEAAKVMDIKLLDHLILSPCGTEFFSFADEGLV